MTRPKRRTIVTAAAVAVVTGLALLVAVGSSPAACTSCHRVLGEISEPLAHSQVGCYSCHAPRIGDKVAFKADEILRMYPRALFGGAPSGPVRETAREACLSCHEDIIGAVLPGDGGYRIDHAACAPEASCDGCHSMTAHGTAVRWKRQPIMEDCTSCHRLENVTDECDACHTGKTRERRLEAGPWQVTHGRNWRTVHGMGDLESCQTCHPDDYCAKCHKVQVPHAKTFGAEHGDAAKTDRKSCTTCHKSDQYCTACHGIEMPHPAGFLRQHSKIAKNTEDPVCERCHTPEDCRRCHTRHIHPGFARQAAGLGIPKVPGQGGDR